MNSELFWDGVNTSAHTQKEHNFLWSLI